MASVRDAVRLLADNPLIARPRRGNLRQWALKGFPYDLWYSTNGKVVFISRVFHQRRDRSKIDQ